MRVSAPQPTAEAARSSRSAQAMRCPPEGRRKRGGPGEPRGDRLAPKHDAVRDLRKRALTAASMPSRTIRNSRLTKRARVQGHHALFLGGVGRHRPRHDRWRLRSLTLGRLVGRRSARVRAGRQWRRAGAAYLAASRQAPAESRRGNTSGVTPDRRVHAEAGAGGARVWCRTKLARAARRGTLRAGRAGGRRLAGCAFVIERPSPRQPEPEGSDSSRRRLRLRVIVRVNAGGGRHEGSGG